MLLALGKFLQLETVQLEQANLILALLKESLLLLALEQVVALEAAQGRSAAAVLLQFYFETVQCSLEVGYVLTVDFETQQVLPVNY